ncbi:MAG: hypothetical protein KF726_28165 [Anaerolineae bacterium]|nr:hypothetical protein [Anaerolineae bacterium]
MTEESPPISKNGLPIRLPDERWEHIMIEHGELSELRDQVLSTISEPERIFVGSLDELMAIREIESGKWLVVVYRELESDGFVITAFVTRRIRQLERRKQVWPA